MVMTKRYGIPYQGSKNRIAKWTVDHLPGSRAFVDLFAGGCAVSHYAMINGKYEKYILNDIEKTPELFKEAITGTLSNDWVSREDFEKEKEKNLFIRYFWSFNNTGKSYLYSKEAEPLKKALHYARVNGDTSLLEKMGIHSNGSYKDIKEHSEDVKTAYIEWYKKNLLINYEEQVKALKLHTDEERREYLKREVQSKIKNKDLCVLLNSTTPSHFFSCSQWKFPTREQYEIMEEALKLPLKYEECVNASEYTMQALQRMEDLQRLDNLQRMENFQRMENLQRLEIITSQKDYREVQNEDASFFYCDPPYKATVGYRTAFDYEAFEEWLNSNEKPCIISESTCPRGCVEIASVDILNLNVKGSTNKKRKEGLYIQERFRVWYDEEMKKLKP